MGKRINEWPARADGIRLFVGDSLTEDDPAWESQRLKSLAELEKRPQALDQALRGLLQFQTADSSVGLVGLFGGRSHDLQSPGALRGTSTRRRMVC